MIAFVPATLRSLVRKGVVAVEPHPLDMSGAWYRIPPMELTPGQLTEYELRATMAERERCIKILRRAFYGEIDTDFRALIACVKSGDSADEE